MATTFDGYPLARQGQGGQALTAAFTSSFVGALFSIVLITFFAPLLAEIALKFGPPEFFAIQLLTFSSFVGLGGGNPAQVPRRPSCSGSSWPRSASTSSPASSG